MFERPHRGERAILVHITITSLSQQATLEEFARLAHSAGVVTVAQITGSRRGPEPNYFVGTGKLEEIKASVTTHQAEVILFNHLLTPTQERNVEQACQCRVLDRTGVILDIFAQRARSFEGKLQVELAQLQYLSTRLIRGWTHLERQRGGIGLRGPGETQLETDRRLIGDRIKNIHKRLEKVKHQRQLGSRARRRAQLPIVSLVGYTNAGKSTLFNHLTHASVYTANQLFATLDPTLRRFVLPDKTTLLLADTVGFIQELPHDLIAAFRATLEETRQATLLLHVVDASDADYSLKIAQVNQVLFEISADTIPQIMVFNKIDCLKNHPARCERDSHGHISQVWLSAQSETGFDFLKLALSEHLSKPSLHRWIRVPAQAGQLRARLFTLGNVLQEHYATNGDSLLEIQISPQQFMQLMHAEPTLQTSDTLAHLNG